MNLFSDILMAPSAPAHTSAVAERVVIPDHHPEGHQPSRAPGTSRLGLPGPRLNPWQRAGRTMLAEACTDPDVAIRQAGLDWTVERVDLRCADTLDPLPKDFAAIRRSDTNAVLACVGGSFEPFQNKAMFDVFSDLARVGREDGGLPFTIETAGAFQGGKVVWALAHLAWPCRHAYGPPSLRAPAQL